MLVIKGKYETRKSCRLCTSSDLTQVLDLGLLPLAGDYLLENELGSEEFFPTKVYFCKNCYLVQLVDIISPKRIFKDYRYLSSFSLTKHFQEYASQISKYLKKGDFIVEIGSNDGVLLEPLKKMGFKVLGVDPARNVAKIANDKGLPTIVDFFNEKTAKTIVDSKGRADAIFANNVLAHIDDMTEVARGVKILLKNSGIFVFEVHYLLDLVEKLQYDFFYPGEHLTYYSLYPIIKFWEKFGLEVFNVERIPIHSGSIRVYLRHKTSSNKSKSVSKLLVLENKKKLYTLQTFKDFAKDIDGHKIDLMKYAASLKRKGKKISGYGAAGRGNTLLNLCKLDNSVIDFIFDHSPQRFGRFTPGTHIPIIDSKEFLKRKSDFSLILAWSYTNEIIKKEKDFLRRGGKFIVPLPKIKIIG